MFSTTAYNSGDDLQPYKYNGKELDRTHGLDWYDYGARNYDAALCQFTTIDPLCEKYYHISPYAYCANNPIMFVDPDGENPVFSSNGMFLGCTSEGYTGQIYIYNFNADLPEDEILDVSKLSDYSIGELCNFNGVSSMDDVELSGDALSNIWTHVVKSYEGNDVLGLTFSINTISDSRISYHKANAGETYNWETSHEQKTIDGTGLYTNYYESTVENLQSSLISHEWFSHLMNNYNDGNKNHRVAYENVINNSDLWEKTTDNYKYFVLRSLYEYTKKETGARIKKTYKKYEK